MNLPGAFLSIANRVTAAMGAPFWDGEIVAPGTGGGYDDDGVYQPGSPPSRHPCRVQVDDATEFMRANEGFADGDVVMIILSASMDIDLNTDMRVQIASGPRAGIWMISQLGRDPASIGWSAKGRPA
ncbi:MAG: hypothetical protein P0Y64_16800 [Candidatus Sphingomonas colombiensis]|nr:hypothetical protein [Sphingomonas sp.]WEK42979.1 MAG: hypothetical protein P0Y64_16800 [Sphingomonas sp.]